MCVCVSVCMCVCAHACMHSSVCMCQFCIFCVYVSHTGGDPIFTTLYLEHRLALLIKAAVKLKKTMILLALKIIPVSRQTVPRWILWSWFHHYILEVEGLLWSVHQISCQHSQKNHLIHNYNYLLIFFPSHYYDYISVVTFLLPTGNVLLPNPPQAIMPSHLHLWCEHRMIDWLIDCFKFKSS